VTEDSEPRDGDQADGPGGDPGPSAPDDGPGAGGGPDDGDAASPQDGPGRGLTAFLKETAIVVALSLVIATVVRIFLVQAFLIPSGSMEDTLLVGDRVLVSKVSLVFGEIHRGDVVVFDDPDHWLSEQAQRATTGGVIGAIKDVFQFVGVLPDDSEDHLIKRVIGVGGDMVACCDDAGRVTVNGVAIDETDYLYPGDAPSVNEFQQKVPGGELFVMGDHRSNSSDSRIHGTFSEDFVVGRTFAVAWPISRWGSVSAGRAFDHVPAP
jgi:signal peptidase I